MPSFLLTHRFRAASDAEISRFPACDEAPLKKDEKTGDIGETERFSGTSIGKKKQIAPGWAHSFTIAEFRSCYAWMIDDSLDCTSTTLYPISGESQEIGSK